MNGITVVARAKAKPGKEEALLAALREAVGPTHREVGCLKYTLHRGVQDPSCIVVLERWASQADLDRHLATPHIQTLFSKVPDLAATPPEIAVYAPVPEGDPAKGTF